ncbi:MAG: class II aldolase/adducin family protein [Actinomycetota bacterium]|nr:class II aldolase/adducin family protein [Actinomycetota bacterium]
MLGAAGNVSERAAELVAITPAGAVLEQLEPEEVVVIDLEANLIEGHGVASSEVALHLGAYQRYGVGAVVHAHPPVATAVACVLEELPVVHYQMAALGGSVRVAPYATFGSQELAQCTLDALADRVAVLMSNHGALTVGPDLGSAVGTARLLEWICTVYWRSSILGPPRELDSDQLHAVVQAVAARSSGTPR